MPASTERPLSYAQAIREALATALKQDDRVVVIGEGVPDPKAIFGTTAALREQFGAERVLDMPLAENGMTGICIGAAMTGMRPVMVHQRIDFVLLAMDQLINNAAKWHFMFNGQRSIPLVVRVIVGRGWGQGPQHSQSLQAMFAHVPGLKVVMPVTPRDAKGMLLSAVQDNNPVLFIEHRWLHPLQEHVPTEAFAVPLDQARLARPGQHVTIAAFSYMVLEALRAASALSEIGIEAEVIDMRSVNPLDLTMVLDSVARTGHLMVADTGHVTGGVAAEVVARVTEQAFSHLKAAPVRVASPDYPVPTTHHLANHYYPDAETIASTALALLGRKDRTVLERTIPALTHSGPKDVPFLKFTGPF